MPLPFPRSRGTRRLPLLGASTPDASEVARDDDPPEEYKLRQLPWSPGITPSWTASAIRSALAAHELGNFSESGRLVDAMGRDDRIAPIASVRERGLLSMPFSIVPPNQEDEEAVAFNLGLEKMWPRIMRTGIAQRLLHGYIFSGFACGQTYWERYGSGWEPRVVDEHPSFMWWQEFEMRYYLTTRDGMQPITPGDGKWFLMEAGERGFKNGAVRALALLWLIRTFTWRDWARYSERHGMPIVKAKVPAQIREDVRRKFWADVVDLGRETSVLLPQGVGPNGEGFDLELLEASSRSWPAFKALQEAANSSIAIYLLGQNLTTEAGTAGAHGSLATAKVHEAVKSQVLAADEREFGDALYWQVMRPVAAMLRPGGEEIVGRPTWDTTPPSDLKVEAETINSMATALKTIQEVGLRVDNVVSFGKRFGIDLVELPPGEDEPPPGEGRVSGDKVLEDKGDGDGKTEDGDPVGARKEPSEQTQHEDDPDFDEKVHCRVRAHKRRRYTRAQADRLTAALLAAVSEAADPEDLRERVRRAYDEG